ncbi:MAG: hypothetical protein WC325_11815 [Candidatus Bathyarchaeia archaeon]|jgi:hypothetical protein
MSGNQKPPKTAATYLILAWMAINLLLMVLLIPGDIEDANNYVELILWSASIVGLWTMKKAGAALTTAVLCITLSTSMGIVFLAYYNNLMLEPVAYINALRIVINAAIIVYMFKNIFANKYQ